jgi:hypothetical protein
MLCYFERIHGQFDGDVPFYFAAACPVVKLFGRFGSNRIAVVIEPIRERSDRLKLTTGILMYRYRGQSIALASHPERKFVTL